MSGLRRAGESLTDAARRVAIDAVYEARDSGGTMHDAGGLAAERVLQVVCESDDDEFSGYMARQP